MRPNISSRDRSGYVTLESVQQSDSLICFPGFVTYKVDDWLFVLNSLITGFSTQNVLRGLPPCLVSYNIPSFLFQTGNFKMLEMEFKDQS